MNHINVPPKQLIRTTQVSPHKKKPKHHPQESTRGKTEQLASGKPGEQPQGKLSNRQGNLVASKGKTEQPSKMTYFEWHDFTQYLVFVKFSHCEVDKALLGDWYLSLGVSISDMTRKPN